MFDDVFDVHGENCMQNVHSLWHAPDTCFKGSWCQFPTQQEFRTLETQSRRRSSEYPGMENMGNAFSQEIHRDP